MPTFKQLRDELRRVAEMPEAEREKEYRRRREERLHRLLNKAQQRTLERLRLMLEQFTREKHEIDKEE